MADNTSDGAELPSMSDADAKAFSDMEAAATAERAGMKGLGGQTVRIAPQDDEPAPTPVVAPVAPVAAPVVPAPVAATPAAPLAPPPGAAPADDDDPDAVLANDGKKYVPLGTMLNVRRNLTAENRDLKAALDLGNTRLNQLLEAHSKVTGQPPAAPVAAPASVAAAPEVNPFDKTTHPLENLEWENQQLKKGLDGVLEWRKGQDAQTAETRALGEAKTAYVSLHNDFAAKDPTYGDAYKWVIDKWVAVGEAMGMSKAQAIQAANQQEWSTVQTAVKGNVHPSQMLMNIAKAAGWTAGASPAVAAAAPGAPAQLGAPAAPAVPSPAKQIELAQQGAAAAISLSDAAGGAPPAAPTLASLAAMSKEEFAQVMDGRKGDALFRKLAMGGGGSSQAA